MKPFLNLNEQQKHLICELLKQTYIHFDPLFHIEIKKETSLGFHITKNHHDILISYHEVSDLCAAIGYILTHQHIDTYEIHQIKSFRSLGLMLDVARNAVLNIETIKSYIRILALLGYNYLELYVEDVMEVESEPLFGYMRGKYSIQDLKEIDDYANQFGIELIPCIQTLAHLDGLFRHSHYRKINDIDDILLVGHHDVYTLIEHMLISTRKAFRSNKINIGMDEAWKLGLGKYLNHNGYQNRFDIMKKHLDEVLSLCKKYNYQPSMWADMFFHLTTGSYHQGSTDFDPSITSQIPKDIKLIYWDYYQKTYEAYDDKFKSMKQLSSNIAFAGGAWKWIGFSSHNHFSEQSMSKAIEAAKDHQISDFLLTAWGDNGAEASCFSILPTLIYIKELAYNHTISKINLDQYSILLTNYLYDEMKAIDLANILYHHHDYKVTNPAKYLLYEDVLISHLMIKPNMKFKKIYQDHKEVLRKLIFRDSHLNYLFKSQYHLLDVLSYKSTLSIETYEAYLSKDQNQIQQVIDHIKQTIIKIELFYEVFKKQWMIENKSLGFEIQTYRIGGLIKRMEEVLEVMTSFYEGKINQILELDERMHCNQEEDIWENTIYFNQFMHIISYNKL